MRLWVVSHFWPHSAFAAAVTGVIYGIEIREAHDEHFKMVERMGEVGEAILIPGKFPVEAFPVLRFLPSWFPGGGFKKFAADAKRDISYIVDHLFETAKTVMVDALFRNRCCDC